MYYAIYLSLDPQAFSAGMYLANPKACAAKN
jgi:hypothetical protein